MLMKSCALVGRDGAKLRVSTSAIAYAIIVASRTRIAVQICQVEDIDSAALRHAAEARAASIASDKSWGSKSGWEKSEECEELHLERLD